MVHRKVIQNTVEAFLALLLMAGGSSVYGDTILVVDTDNFNAFTTHDHSTDGDSTAGLTGTYSSSVTPSYADTQTGAEYYLDSHAGFLVGGSGATATWSVTGFTPGQQVTAYVNWRGPSSHQAGGGQANNDPAATYTVNGGTPVVHDQTVALGTLFSFRVCT